MTAVNREQLAANQAFRVDILTGNTIEVIKFKSREELPVYKGSDPYWDNILLMDGNLDDEAFRLEWFKRTSGRWD
jgi:hypothetical protein